MKSGAAWLFCMNLSVERVMRTGVHSVSAQLKFFRLILKLEFLSFSSNPGSGLASGCSARSVPAFHTVFTHRLAPGTSVRRTSLCLTPLTVPLFFPLRQTAAGRTPRPPRQWLHPQKDPEAFTLTPPTDPPPSSASPLPPLPPPHPWPYLPKLKPIWTGRDMTDCTRSHGWGLGRHFHRYGQIFHFSRLDHGSTVSSLRRGLTSTLHSLYSFHLMSMLPLCISLYNILYPHSRHTLSSIMPLVL